MNMRRSLLLAPIAWALPARAQTEIPPALVDYAGQALATLIDTARRRAIADGVQPLPAGIYRSLLGFFPAGLLQKVRFGIGGIEPLDLPALTFSYGDAIAMTLGEIVLFKSEHQAETDTKVWAHEMTHVMQYQRWGVEGFADRYVRDSAAVEREAVDNAKRFVAWRSGRS